jgi:hypothetical protein
MVGVPDVWLLLVNSASGCLLMVGDPDGWLLLVNSTSGCLLMVGDPDGWLLLVNSASGCLLMVWDPDGWLLLVNSGLQWDPVNDVRGRTGRNRDEIAKTVRALPAARAIRWHIHGLRNIHNADNVTAAAGDSCRRAACSGICALRGVRRGDGLAPQGVVFLVCVYFFFRAVDSLEPLFGFDDDERKIPCKMSD